MRLRIELMQRFTVHRTTSNAVLDLRLYQLTGLERDKIKDEYQELLKKIDYYRAVLASEAMVRDIIKEELQRFTKNTKSERKTQIIPAESEMNMEDLIANEPVIITISEDDYIKRMPIDTFREQRRGGQGMPACKMKREADDAERLYVANNHDYLLIFTSLGVAIGSKCGRFRRGRTQIKGKPLD